MGITPVGCCVGEITKPHLLKLLFAKNFTDRVKQRFNPIRNFFNPIKTF